MILVEKIPVKKSNKISNMIYINTLIPNFQFKNKLGELTIPSNHCINL